MGKIIVGNDDDCKAFFQMPRQCDLDSGSKTANLGDSRIAADTALGEKGLAWHLDSPINRDWDSQA